MPDFLHIADVLKPQGIKGEIKVKTQTDSVEDIMHFKRVYISGTEYKVLSTRTSGDFAYLSLLGVADRDRAETLRGAEVLALREDAPSLPENTYYIVDLIGCAVLADGAFLGTVTDVIPAKTDIYEIAQGDKKRQFVAADGVIEGVDIKNKKILVNRKRFNECSLDI